MALLVYAFRVPKSVEIYNLKNKARYVKGVLEKVVRILGVAGPGKQLLSVLSSRVTMVLPLVGAHDGVPVLIVCSRGGSLQQWRKNAFFHILGP